MSGIAAQSYFPPVTTADADGMLTVGGELNNEWLVDAYQHGIFPWPIVSNGVEVLTWWSPARRAIIELDELYVSRRLRRRIRSGEFVVSFNEDFESVIQSCAQPRGIDSETWITPSLINAYVDFHYAGYAHSVEVWRGGQLAGGLYGVSLGGFFAGESMFHRCSDASKVALVALVNRLRDRGFELFDIQQYSPHTGRMGAKEVSRRRFLSRLKRALDLPVSFVGL